MKRKTILSLSSDAAKLMRREAALSALGFEVRSVSTPGQARFEIEMGQCGIFLTCGCVPDIANEDLIRLFKRNCSTDGLVIFVESSTASRETAIKLPIDFRVPSELDLAGIVEVLSNIGPTQSAA